jgi:hypothetical protein
MPNTKTETVAIGVSNLEIASNPSFESISFACPEFGSTISSAQ